MARHVWERSFLFPESVATLIEIYNLNKRKLKSRYAKKYALWFLEASQQTGGTYYRYRKHGKYSYGYLRNECTPELFDQLLESAKYGPYRIRNEAFTAITDSWLKHPKKADQAELLLESKDKLLSVLGSRVAQDLDWRSTLAMRDRRSWSNLVSWDGVSRGRDLFISGLGGFNINDAFQEYSMNRVFNPLHMIPSTSDITAKGYCPSNSWSFNNAVLEGSESKRDHVIRHWHSFYRDNHAVLDEVARSPVEEFDPSVKPHIYLQTTEELLEQLAESRAKRGTNDFSWVQEAGDLETPRGTLHVLKERMEFYEIGKAMHNCASGYSTLVGSREGIMVVLMKNNKPKVLGWMDSKGDWGQILASCNRTPNDADEAVFYGHTSLYQLMLKEARKSLV